LNRKPAMAETNSIACNTHKCPPDGGWSTWTTFTQCSRTCNKQEEEHVQILHQ
jgi:hypothetical protein